MGKLGKFIKSHTGRVKGSLGIYPKDIVGKLGALHNIPFINAGGCGVVAYGLYQYAKREGKEPKLLYLYHDDCYELDNLRKGVPESANHVVVQIGGNCYDTYGVKHIDGIKNSYITIEVADDYLFQSLNETYWNTMYDRRHNKDIGRAFGVDLSGISLEVKDYHD